MIATYIIFAIIIYIFMEHLIKFLELLKDKKVLFGFLKAILSLPFSIMFYKMGGGRFYFDDFSKKRIALFFTNGEFLIGIILFLFSFFFLRYFLPFILDLLIYPFFYRLAKPLIKTMCKISRVIRLKKKNMLSELKPRNNKDKIIYPNMKKLLRFFYFKRIEKREINYQIVGLKWWQGVVRITKVAIFVV